MHVSRASSRALKQLASTTQSRSLHMTGPATFSSLLTTERPASNHPRDQAGLRAECQKHKLSTTGTQAELLGRLSAHEVASSRGFSTAAQESKRPVPETPSAGQPIRHFNTSRSLKSVNDTSTIDFCYIPDFDPDAQTAPVMRVPIISQTVMSQATTTNAAEAEEALPAIFTAIGDQSHVQAMKDVHDNSSVDFQGVAATVASKITKPIEEGVGMTRQLWNGLVDDILGPKSKRTA